MNGTFSLNAGVLQFSKLAYFIPGAQVNLDGVYSLDGQQFDFHGKVLTEVALSQMVDNRVLVVPAEGSLSFFQAKRWRSRDSGEDQRHQVGAEVRP